MKSLFSKHFTLIILSTFSLLLSVGCRETIKSLSDLTALRDALAREYSVQDIDVVLHDFHVLGITFHNSSFNDLGEQEMAGKAQEIALFARSHYAAIDSVDKIQVSFVISKNYIIFQYSDGLGSYLFEKIRLTPSGAPDNVGQHGNIIMSYNPAAHQTSVYLKKNLQLYGDSGSNVMLLPHFIIPGDNVRAPKIIFPESVALDFTAYSKKRMFSDEPQLIIYVDGQKIFSGTAQVTNVLGSNEEASVNEFLSREITYRQFLQLTAGKRVKIILGTKEFELKGEQLGVLQGMRKCVEELRCT